ncbi:hypothetical protein [Luteimonas sp. MC1572]|uniref:hypothetical protein n=1 Tax=Luteimonas sp. MC1572 TaxID=2799325 RepID=UPI0018F0CCCC|nr:hypothetical protein [Luteimonas sp. MC1572]MBJ6983021.1 hypothetical protein [Luteimonas sp. MC1572]QQO03250.1 hypothetical protein JGR64_00240 [Luteimonas sp. MC1572]
MNLWSLAGAVVFGGVFALFASWGADSIDSQAVRGTAAFFLFGFYCAIVIFATSGKKRSLSLPAQTLLGVALSCAVAAIFGASGEGYALAVVLGLILGFTADRWVAHVQLP